MKQRYQLDNAINNARLDNSFYRRDDVVSVAKELLGKCLYTEIDGCITAGIISETEAYHQDERACHAYGGKRTARTTTLFNEGGLAYVYLCYGIHHLFNVVTGPEGNAQVVLIRGVIPHKGLETMLRRRKMKKAGPNLSAGPGTMSRALGITTSLNGLDLTSSKIWIEDELANVEAADIKISNRIGVDYAGEDALLPWRFNLNPNWEQMNMEI